MGVVSCGTTMLDQGVFNNIGAVTWDTTAKTAGFTAVSGNGYFVNTTSGAITVTLPSSPSAGDIVGIKDYANTADTNNITIDRNGSFIQGTASNFIINTEGRSVLLVYVDGTQGWKVTSASQASDIQGPAFVTATGGTITTSGNFKIHTFTSPGTFTVTCAGNACGSNSVSYMVVAGGGGGSSGEGVADPTAISGGGGGAGGFREGKASSDCYTASPLNAPAGLPVSVQGYPITVGGGGSGTPSSPPRCGGKGSDSSFSTITSTGGGGGGGGTGNPGGSGGAVRGGCIPGTAGTGNTPPVSPPQGNPGGDNSGCNSPPFHGSGGGGATAAGGTNGPGTAGTGGAGATTSISGSPTAYAGGGGGGDGFPGTTSGAGGIGGGGGGAPPYDGSTNTGGGGGGGPSNPGTSGSGGSGIVIIRYKYQ